MPDKRGRRVIRTTEATRVALLLVQAGGSLRTSTRPTSRGETAASRTTAGSPARRSGVGKCPYDSMGVGRPLLTKSTRLHEYSPCRNSELHLPFERLFSISHRATGPIFYELGKGTSEWKLIQEINHLAVHWHGTPPCQVVLDAFHLPGDHQAGQQGH